MTLTVTFLLPDFLHMPEEMVRFTKKLYPRVRVVELDAEEREQRLTKHGAEEMQKLLRDTRRVCIFINSIDELWDCEEIDLPNKVLSFTTQHWQQYGYYDIFGPDNRSWRWHIRNYLQQQMPQREFPEVPEQDAVTVLYPYGDAPATAQPTVSLLLELGFGIDSVDEVAVDPCDWDHKRDVLRNPAEYCKIDTPTLVVGCTLEWYSTTQALRNNPHVLYLLEFDSEAHEDGDPAAWKHMFVWKGQRYKGAAILPMITKWKEQIFNRMEAA